LREIERDRERDQEEKKKGFEERRARRARRG